MEITDEKRSKYFSLFKNIIPEKPESLSLNSKPLIIDGLNTFIRAYSTNTIANDNGIHVGGIIGTLLSIGYAAKLIRPTRIILVFDGKGGSLRRRKLYPEYKAKRRTSLNLLRPDYYKTAEEDIENRDRQLMRLMNYLETLPISIISADNIEADDSIAYITTNILNKDSQITIMSSDRDFLQLINKNVKVWSPTKKILYDQDTLYNEYGLIPHNYLIYRTLKGDPSDNIDGIKGCGIKTVRKNFPFLYEKSNAISIEEIINIAIEREKKSKVYESVSKNKDQIHLNFKLMQLHDVDISTHTKILIREQLERAINSYSKVDFLKYIFDDKINLGNIDISEWLQKIFFPLDHFAAITRN